MDIPPCNTGVYVLAGFAVGAWSCDQAVFDLQVVPVRLNVFILGFDVAGTPLAVPIICRFSPTPPPETAMPGRVKKFLLASRILHIYRGHFVHVQRC